MPDTCRRQRLHVVGASGVRDLKGLTPTTQVVHSMTNKHEPCYHLLQARCDNGGVQIGSQPPGHAHALHILGDDCMLLAFSTVR